MRLLIKKNAASSGRTEALIVPKCRPISKMHEDPHFVTVTVRAAALSQNWAAKFEDPISARMLFNAAWMRAHRKKPLSTLLSYALLQSELGIATCRILFLSIRYSATFAHCTAFLTLGPRSRSDLNVLVKVHCYLRVGIRGQEQDGVTVWPTASSCDFFFDRKQQLRKVKRSNFKPKCFFFQLMEAFQKHSKASTYLINLKNWCKKDISEFWKVGNPGSRWCNSSVPTWLFIVWRASCLSPRPTSEWVARLVFFRQKLEHLVWVWFWLFYYSFW